ncbi:MAG: thioredoxin family protein, partial [Verrucomicrobiaceae bacterium]|nr:thioredoxin family protein [Verrucomicrobiaceae bacterium]
MNTSNLPLWIVGAVILYIGFIAFDMSQPDASSPGGKTSIAAVRTEKVPVLVEFYADWCGPCKVVGPVVDELARELKGRAVVVRINVDEQ